MKIWALKETGCSRVLQAKHRHRRKGSENEWQGSEWYSVVFGHVLDLTCGLFVLFLSFEDVCSCQCSSRCFPIAVAWFFSLNCFSFRCAEESS